MKRVWLGGPILAALLLAGCAGAVAPASSAVASPASVGAQGSAAPAGAASKPAGGSAAVSASLPGKPAASSAAASSTAGAAKPAASGTAASGAPGTAASGAPGAAAGGAPGVAASGAPGVAASGSAASGSAAASGALTPITLALGYIPNVQFAPFYVARDKGFYKDEGIDISFDNGISPDLIKSVGAGKFKFTIADPDTTISAREQAIPVTYIAGFYPQSPIAVISLPKAGITRVQDLKGKKVGIPGRFGSSYVALLGMLNKAGLTEKDIDLQEIGFNQPPQLLAGKVDAVIGFANNDALQVQAQSGAKPNSIPVGDVIPFIGQGLIVNDDTMKTNDKLAQAMTTAMLKGMQYTAAHPDEAFQTTVKVVPEAGGANAKLNQDVLAATIPFFKDKNTDANGLGWTDPADWKSLEDVMASAGIVKTPPPIAQAMTNKYISKDLK
jgi:NitT/TauT family transport system substrate-binding protein